MSILKIFIILYTILLVLIFLGLLAINLSSYKKKPQLYKNFKLDKSFKTLVICPCKGVDVTLNENLKSLKYQSYKNYDLLCVVDNKGDPAVKVIKEQKINYIISDKNIGNGSGKVRAIATALSRFKNYDIYIIADSDVTFVSDWVENLVKPFSCKKIGATTSYPFFNPINGFWSKVKMVWSYAGNGMMESDITIFGWGGSLAFRKSLFSNEIIKDFANSLSDDIYITKLVKSNRLKLYYKSMQIKVNSNDSFKVFWEWSNRQTALTLLGYPKNFTYGVIFYSVQELLLFSSIILSILITPLYLILLLPFILGEIKTIKRSYRYKIYSIFIFFFINIIYVINLVKAKNMTQITWRGRDYKMSQNLSK